MKNLKHLCNALSPYLIMIGAIVYFANLTNVYEFFDYQKPISVSLTVGIFIGLIVFMRKFSKIMMLRMEFEQMRSQYRINATVDYKTINILWKIDISPTLTNILFKRAKLSSYIEDKILLYELEKYK